MKNQLILIAAACAVCVSMCTSENALAQSFGPKSRQYRDKYFKDLGRQRQLQQARERAARQQRERQQREKQARDQRARDQRMLRERNERQKRLRDQNLAKRNADRQKQLQKDRQKTAEQNKLRDQRIKKEAENRRRLQIEQQNIRARRAKEQKWRASEKRAEAMRRVNELQRQHKAMKAQNKSMVSKAAQLVKTHVSKAVRKYEAAQRLKRIQTKKYEQKVQQIKEAYRNERNDYRVNMPRGKERDFGIALSKRLEKKKISQVSKPSIAKILLNNEIARVRRIADQKKKN